jgi:hypothetical protein
MELDVRIEYGNPKRIPAPLKRQDLGGSQGEVTAAGAAVVPIEGAWAYWLTAAGLTENASPNGMTLYQRHSGPPSGDFS